MTKLNLLHLQIKWVLILISSMLCITLSAQEDPDADLFPQDDGFVISNFVVDREVFGGGIFYFAILEVESNDVILRGTMDVEGVDRVILAPETAYRFLSFYAETLSFGFVDFTTPPAGRNFIIPCMDYVVVEQVPDFDLDEISDDLELIAGTDPMNPDTDKDGFLDGVEIKQGQNPLDGFVQTTGIIASGPTPGPAIDICAINNILMVACGEAGVSVFNARAGDAPTRIAQVNTPGNASAITCFGNLVGVADGAAGLAVIDISDPPRAFIRHQVRTRSPAISITARGNFAFVGLQNGRILMVDMVTGIELSEFRGITAPIMDLGERNGYLYALVTNRIHTIEINDGAFNLIHSLNITARQGAGRYRLRLFVGDDFLYPIDTAGYSAVDISNPTTPTLVEYFRTAQIGWKHIQADGSGLGVAAVSPNSTRDGPHHVDLYRVGDDNRGSVYTATFETPGIATAIALYNGFAYIADDARGIHVLNYLGADVLGQPPTISLNVPSSNQSLEEGKIFSAIASVTDDVQIRNVEFFIDGQAIALDGSFPYELGLIAPLRQPGKTTFDVHAVVTDTGGNSATSEVLSFELVPDATPPRVRNISPENGSVIGKATSALITLSEVIDRGSLNNSSLKFVGAGPDKILFTADDIIPPHSVEYNSETATIGMVSQGTFEPDLYGIRVSSPLRDLAGNRIERPSLSSFRIFGFEDRDRDGVPDDLEPELNLDPDNPDTNGNGILDGKEDFDRDLLSNAGEIYVETDPRIQDTDGNGIWDGREDFDLDSLINADEVKNGTDAKLVDSDGDGVDDAAEIAEGTNPLDKDSVPTLQVASEMVSYLNALRGRDSGRDLPTTIASPLVSYLNALPASAGDEFEFTLASPLVSFLNGLQESSADGFDVSLTSPLVSYLNTGFDQTDESSQFFVASPLVSYRNGPEQGLLTLNSESFTKELNNEE